MKGRTIALVGLAMLLGAGLLAGGFWIGRASAAWAFGSGQLWPMMSGPGMMGPGMMGGRYGWGATSAEPLSIDQARQAVDAYLARLGDSELAVGEIMIFDNHAYAEVVNTASESGAFEVLIDPVSRTVSLEYGPSMMWNTEYGMMGGRGYGMTGGRGNGGMGGGMMGGWLQGAGAANPTGEGLTETEALEIAQAYLAEYLPGVETSDEADPFPGYFTIHTLKDGQILGMLSVNATTGQVWVHTWHGAFIEMSE